MRLAVDFCCDLVFVTIFITPSIRSPTSRFPNSSYPPSFSSSIPPSLHPHTRIHPSPPIISPRLLTLQIIPDCCRIEDHPSCVRVFFVSDVAARAKYGGRTVFQRTPLCHLHRVSRPTPPIPFPPHPPPPIHPYPLPLSPIHCPISHSN